MTRPRRSSKLLLVADRREPAAKGDRAPVRRYRLARVRLDGRALVPVARPVEWRRVSS